MSASKMRKAVTDNDFESFENGLPSGFKKGQELFDILRNEMGIKSFNEWVLYESNIFQNKYLNDHDVILGTVAKTRKDVMVAWGEAGYAVGDSFTTSANYKGKTSDVVLGSGKYSIIMKDGSGEYIKVKGAMTHINNSLHHKGGATKGPAGQDWENIITHHYNNLINKPISMMILAPKLQSHLKEKLAIMEG